MKAGYNALRNALLMLSDVYIVFTFMFGLVFGFFFFFSFFTVHYMRDKSRGVVWEEVIIMLPDAVRFVFLSATIPNSTEFALWVAKLHKQPCSVVYTDFRPTPLQHYVFPAGGDGLYLVMDEKGNFREDNFQKVRKKCTRAHARQRSAVHLPANAVPLSRATSHILHVASFVCALLVSGCA